VQKVLPESGLRSLVYHTAKRRFCGVYRRLTTGGALCSAAGSLFAASNPFRFRPRSQLTLRKNPVFEIVSVRAAAVQIYLVRAQLNLLGLSLTLVRVCDGFESFLNRKIPARSVNALAPPHHRAITVRFCVLWRGVDRARCRLVTKINGDQARYASTGKMRPIYAIIRIA
jgi:hypothetical protein